VRKTGLDHNNIAGLIDMIEKKAKADKEKAGDKAGGTRH